MRSISALIASLSVLVILAGCAATAVTPADHNPCRQACSVSIDLAAQVGQRPGAPDWFRVVGGEEVDFEVDEVRGLDVRTILSFEEAAFRDENGNPVYTLELESGSNPYQVRPYRDGVCRAPRGCRYVVINVGTPQRPGVIDSPRIIIDPR